jgi:lysophospholipase L1-like esterase
MAQWDWLVKPEAPYNWRFVLRVVIKAAILFVLFNLVFALVKPLPALGSLSLYNHVLPGRERLPYGENPALSYSLSLNNLDAMFASHVVSLPKAADEYRVLVMGDSSTWGWLLKPEDTLVGALNARNLTATDGRHLRFYNLGYPEMSLTKDLMLLDYAMRYQPDSVLWLVTAESFPRQQKQLFPALVQSNADRVRALIAQYHLNLDLNDSRFVNPSFFDSTLVGQRRSLADVLRLQLYGVPFAETGIDQYYPAQYTLHQSDFDVDLTWQDWKQPQPLTEKELAFDVLAAGVARVGNLPVLIVNEPMFISAGKNSDLRYNAFYPRWAYDQYHDLLNQTAQADGWHYLDLWNRIDGAEFTDSPVHLTPKGARQLAEMIMPELRVR